jgi:putative ABC transport system permease protein
MSLFQIAYRSITQRPVASVLTLLSMGLGVMLVVAVLAIHGIISQSFRSNASLGYNMIVGAKGGQEQIVLNTVYYLSRPVENIPYTYYLEFLKREERDKLQAESYAVEALAALAESQELLSLAGGGLAEAVEERVAARQSLKLVPDTRAKPHFPPVEVGRHGKYGQMTELAIPLCLGDYFGRFRVVGTTPALFDDLVWDLENNRKFEFAQGRNFEWYNAENEYFEAVVGASVAREMGVTLNQKISPAHGDPEGHLHQRKFTVVGILKPSGTPNDRAVFVNMEGFYLMENHAMPLEEEQPAVSESPKAPTQEEWLKMKAEAARKKSEIERSSAPLPVEQREVTAVLLKIDPIFAPGIENGVNEGTLAQAVLPVAVIYRLFEFFVSPIQWTLLFLTAMICVVSGISILVSIYNSMSERRGEIAVMRALGAGRETVMSIILIEATLLALGGGVFGWLAAHVACYAASPWIEERTGVRVGLFDPTTLPVEAVLIPLLVVLAVLVGIWPAISAYRTDVAKSLGK